MAISKQQVNLEVFQPYELPLLSQEGQHKIRRVIILASTVFALLYFFSLQLNKTYIEQDLTARSLAGLSNENVDVVFSGRDASVTGTVASEQEATQLVNKIAQVWGVRTVNNQLHRVQADAQDFKDGSLARQLMETGQVILGDLQFSSASVVLSEQAVAKLDDLLKAIKTMPGTVFKISGHTDSTGDEESNFTLSLKRAESVKAYLIKHQVQESQLIAKGYGDSQPIADNRSVEGRKKNRRIEIIQLKPGMLK